jgi:hypothetical protein
MIALHSVAGEPSRPGRSICSVDQTTLHERLVDLRRDEDMSSVECRPGCAFAQVRMQRHAGALQSNEDRSSIVGTLLFPPLLIGVQARADPSSHP